MKPDLQQVLLSIAPSVLPMLAIFLGILSNNRQIDFLRNELKSELALLRGDLKSDISLLRQQMSTAEGLRRVEEVMDARLKHLEERA